MPTSPIAFFRLIFPLTKTNSLIHHKLMQLPVCPNLTFKKIVREDLQDFLVLVRDPHVKEFLLEGLEVSDEEGIAWIAEADNLQNELGLGLYLVYEKTQLLGYCGYTKAHAAPDVIDIVYAFPKKYSGKGLASKVCAALVKLAQEVSPQTPLSAVVNPFNYPSMRVLEKNGFKFRGPGFGELNHLHRYLLSPKIETAKDKVYEVYNKIGDWFHKVRSQDLKFEHRHLTELTSHLTKGAKVLDLGCGTGKPIAEYLISQGFNVTGIDGSQKMIEIAKKNIPQARLLHQDMRKIELNEKFDAIIMWHSSFHLPASDQEKLFPVLRKLLNPKGLLMFTSGTTNGEVWSNNGGESLYHASLATNEYRALLSQNDFEVLNYCEEDKSAGGATIWLARKF